MTPRNRQIAIGKTGEYVRHRIRDLRERQNLTYAELARRVGDAHNMTDQTVRRIEGGKRRIDVDDLAAIADALGVGVTELLAGPDQSPVMNAVTPESVEAFTRLAHQIAQQAADRAVRMMVDPKDS